MQAKITEWGDETLFAFLVFWHTKARFWLWCFYYHTFYFVSSYNIHVFFGADAFSAYLIVCFVTLTSAAWKWRSFQLTVSCDFECSLNMSVRYWLCLWNGWRYQRTIVGGMLRWLVVTGDNGISITGIPENFRHADAVIEWTILFCKYVILCVLNLNKDFRGFLLAMCSVGNMGHLGVQIWSRTHIWTTTLDRVSVLYAASPCQGSFCFNYVALIKKLPVRFESYKFFHFIVSYTYVNF